MHLAVQINILAGKLFKFLRWLYSHMDGIEKQKKFCFLTQASGHNGVVATVIFTKQL